MDVGVGNGTGARDTLHWERLFVLVFEVWV